MALKIVLGIEALAAGVAVDADEAHGLGHALVGHLAVIRAIGVVGTVFERRELARCLVEMGADGSRARVVPVWVRSWCLTRGRN